MKKKVLFSIVLGCALMLSASAITFNYLNTAKAHINPECPNGCIDECDDGCYCYDWYENLKEAEHDDVIIQE